MSSLSHPATGLSHRAPHLSRQRSSGPFSRLVAWAALMRQRTDLAQLDEHLRDDLGLTRQDVADELSRPSWDAPSHWRG
ncbi:DUF1127 domain-containing protein [Palleronia pelagia]|uniref:Uncharacterized conserved protein YjiS, DUF1127 family n=1 Tax=Palleronia pelagia TaxID=387096 RepID=A0A1H8GZL9_9RHOB|nr:DUF1127 domain-containing protein [Palleronia pelagia]SEN49581.1 Uncharacterized conserved protein YjiS, DUF1127 family [Palleronia pelagia]